MGTPFPWPPMVAISTGLVAHSYALSSLFPYVGYMVQHLGVTDDKDEAGFFAGYLSSAFMVGRFGSSYFWGRFADRYGRLPVMYVGLCSIALLSVAFGLSTTFLWAVTCRFLLGAMNGLIAIAKTMISEVCGREHEVVGMSFVTGCWSIGLVLGSGLGGLLAEPANHYPTVFSESGLFGRFPYLLPNILGASPALIGLPLVYFFLEETLDVHMRGDRRGFEPLPTSEAELHIQEATADEGGGVEMTDLDNGYDSGLAKADRVRSHSDGGGGGRGGGSTPGSAGNSELETVGNNTCNGNSAQARAEERLPLARRRSRSSSGAQDLEGGEVLSSAHGGAHGSARSASDGIRQGGGVDAGGGESQGEARRRQNACLRECLLPLKLLEEKRVRTVLFVYVLFSFISIGSQEVYPLWALSTLANGGLDWTTKQIGQFLDFGFDEVYPLWTISSGGNGGLDWTTQEVGQALSACGGGMLIFQLLMYPWIVKRIGAKKSQRCACCVAIPVFLAYPFLSRLHDSEGALLAASLVLLFFTSVASNAVFINVALATNNAVDPSRRGTVNGLSMTLGSLAKAAGPTAASTVFAWSIHRHHPFPFDHHLIFYLMALGMIVVTAASWNVVISPVDPKPKGATVAPVVVAEEAPEEVGRSGVSS